MDGSGDGPHTCAAAVASMPRHMLVALPPQLPCGGLPCSAMLPALLCPLRRRLAWTCCRGWNRWRRAPPPSRRSRVRGFVVLHTSARKLTNACRRGSPMTEADTSAVSGCTCDAMLLLILKLLPSAVPRSTRRGRAQPRGD